MSAIARRLDRLEARLGLMWTPETYALAERIAADEGIPAAELVASVEETMRAIGPPYTVARFAAYIAQRDGISVDDLLAAVNRSIENYR
jgi:hypothetical protein